MIANAKTVFRNRDPSFRCAEAHAGPRRAHRRALDRPRELPLDAALPWRRRWHVARDFAHSLGDIAASPFELRLDALGSFGGRKPRAIFAAVAPSNALELLQRAHERAARAAGLPPERRNYTPHVTVARLRGTSSESVATYLERQGGFLSEPFEVSRFVLFSSRASVGGGPYVVEAAYPLED